MIIHIGEKPNSQINNADTTGIHKLYRLILADRPMVKVGAAINATTAGRIPLNMLQIRPMNEDISAKLASGISR
mgnify:CR=1 FL=1